MCLERDSKQVRTPNWELQRMAERKPGEKGRTWVGRGKMLVSGVLTPDPKLRY